MSEEHWSAVYDSARAVRVNALRSFGFTERQSRFVVNVMAHSGSFLERQVLRVRGHRAWAEQPRVCRSVGRTRLCHGDHPRDDPPRSHLSRAPQAAVQAIGLPTRPS